MKRNSYPNLGEMSLFCPLEIPLLFPRTSNKSFIDKTQAWTKRAVVDIGPVVVVVCFFLIDHAAMSRASLGLLAPSTTTTLFIIATERFPN